MRHLIVYILLPTCAGATLAQSLPPPSRTIYKCEQGEKVSYSDEPCVGAKALDIVVPRGLDKLSGQRRTGDDVLNEVRHEQFANALQPISGMTPEQLATATRRRRLSNPAQLLCRQLDQALPQAEAREPGLTGEALRQVQLSLYDMRKQYKLIDC
ncbi:MAG: hypothetical protein JWP59_1993 [Massilia sp.]|jgi:hypothetical protein|nr:hypothetical protein [Massilia sp.]